MNIFPLISITRTTAHLTIFFLPVISSCITRFFHWSRSNLSSSLIITMSRGRSQSLKEVLQNFTEGFNIDDVTANDVYRESNIGTKKKLSSIVITDVKLTSSLKNNSEFCFSFLWQKHCHSKIPDAWLCVYVCITVLFWQKVNSAFSASIYLFKAWIVTLK